MECVDISKRNPCHNSKEVSRFNAQLHVDGIYNQFSENLMIQTKPTSELSTVLQKIEAVINKLKQKTSFKVKDVCFGGTSEPNMKCGTHADVIVLLDENVTILETFVKKAKHEVQDLSEVKLLDVCDRSFFFSMGKVFIDLVAFPTTSVKPYEDNLQKLGDSDKNHRARVLEFTRLWNQLIYFESYIPGRLSTIELLAMRAASVTSKDGNMSVVRAIHTFLDYVDDLTKCQNSIKNAMVKDACYITDILECCKPKILFVKPLIPANAGLTTSNIKDVITRNNFTKEVSVNTSHGLLKKIILTNPEVTDASLLYSLHSPIRFFYAIMMNGLQLKDIFVEFRRKSANLQGGYNFYSEKLKNKSDVNRIDFYIERLNLLIHILEIDYEARVKSGMIKDNTKDEMIFSSLSKLFLERKGKKNNALNCFKRKVPKNKRWEAFRTIPYLDGRIQLYFSW